MNSPTQKLGFKAEKTACEFLKGQGMKLICANFRTPFGEIDLIMQDQRTTVFIEVRYRKQNNFVSALESINYKKQTKIIKSAQFYMQKNRVSSPCRFDVVTLEPHINHDDIHWIKDAFQVQ